MSTDSAGQPWAGRTLNPSPFAGDDGSADPALAAALAAYGAGREPLSTVVGALAGVRLLVPVLAELEVAEHGPHGVVDKEASAGVVALAAPDGRRALPVFSSTAAMASWKADARPVPVEAERAALAAVAEEWSLIVLDPGGPVTAVVPRPAVWALAQQRPWQPAVVGGAVVPDVGAALAEALAGLPGLVRAEALPGRTAEVAVVLRLRPGLDREALESTVRQAHERLAADPVVTDRVDSVELRVAAAD